MGLCRPIHPSPCPQVYQCIADYCAHHPHFLPKVFSDLRVIQGGVGRGTVITVRFNAGGVVQVFRAIVEEPEPERVLTEEDHERRLDRHLYGRPRSQRLQGPYRDPGLLALRAAPGDTPL